MSAADRAKRAQGAAAKSFKKQQGKAVARLERGQRKVGMMIQGVQAPVYDYAAMERDAERATASNIRQIDEFLPGAAAQREKQLQLTNQAMDILGGRLQGQYGQDVTQKAVRDAAEFAGAGFNPATAGRAGGFQASQGTLAEQLARTTLDVQNQALQLFPQISNIAADWNRLAGGFISNVADFGRLQLGYQGAAAEVGLQKARMTGDMFSNIFNAQSGLASQIYGANKESAAASYAAQQAVGQGFSDIGQAASGAFMTGAQISAAQQGLNIGGIGGGGFNYEQAYGRAIPAGGRTTPGFGNFDYGSGTGA
jgi:hypothetical protein